MADILKELVAKIPWYRKRMFELHGWVVEAVTVALNDKQRSITQKELAEKMEIDPASLSRSLSFKGANLTLETVGKFEQAIGKPILRTRADVKNEIADNLPEALALLNLARRNSNAEIARAIKQKAAQYGGVNNQIEEIYGEEQEATTVETYSYANAA